ncbi:metal ion permease [Candidatus Tenderia electrophaga]|jgi:YHS domain-containing protein|uniref:Metal ion permease n=1 Tax=Candidatus Tenderia electrophaga TaxID=1748243 RepID=A0A0S2TF65_9GAMM|nr:metal ion permease [Candidatus Tenderia electrophaga]
MDGLLTFLIFAGLFYVMMRFGCGAHMVHGHGDHSGHGSGGGKHIDPVCGMEVEVDKGYGKMYEGTLYRFCSKSCLDKFDANPEQYPNKPPDSGEHGEDLP